MAWLAGASVSALGDGVFYFALGWAASAIGPRWGGIVLTMIILPRALLLLFGGAVADRWGARRVMIVGDAVMCAVALALAVFAHTWGVGPILLMVVATAVGTVDAFYLPAMGAFPRLLVRDEQLPRALSLRQSTAHIVSLASAPAAGALLMAGGISTAAIVNAATFAAVLVVLTAVRPRVRVALEVGGGSVLADAVAGVRLVLANPTLTALLVSTGLVAAVILPTTSLCVPLLAREHGWTPSAAGIVVGGVACGGLAASLIVARRGMLGPPGLVAGVATVVAGAGIAGIAVSPHVAWAVAAAVAQGAGVGMFVSHLAPLVMALASSSHQARSSPCSLWPRPYRCCFPRMASPWWPPTRASRPPRWVARPAPRSPAATCWRNHGFAGPP